MSKDIPGAGTRAAVAEVAEEKKSETAQMVSDILKEVLPSAMAAAAVTAANMVTGRQTPSAPAPASREVCDMCRQMKRTGCMGEHVMVAVYPKREEFAENFQGVFINGVKYLSNGPEHLIPIPSNSEVMYLLNKWEENEAQVRLGRKKQHNSGTTRNFQKTNALGFR